MRFFTPEWYMSIQFENGWRAFTEIPDKAYTPAEIRAFYNSLLEEELEEDRRDSDENDPFDPERTKKEFIGRYRHNIRKAAEYYPEWMCRAVDVRLIGLRLLPSSAYRRYREECLAVRESSKAMYREYEAVRASQEIPLELEKALALHDASLLSLRKSGNDLVMLVNKCGSFPDDQTPYRRVTFKNAAILERGKGLSPRKRPGEYGEGFVSGIDLLYSEIYRAARGWEVHVMFFNDWKLPCLTLICSDIAYADGVAV